MRRENLSTGKSGEKLAADFLRKSGYKIIATNYRNRLGEIDIIARDKDTLCFVEVKTRTSDRYGSPKEALSYSKQRHMAKAALFYLKEKGLLEKRARFDLVSITGIKEKPQFELLQNAFELDREFVY